MCINTHGGYICKCKSGYKQHKNGRVCVDEGELCKDVKKPDNRGRRGSLLGNLGKHKAVEIYLTKFCSL